METEHKIGMRVIKTQYYLLNDYHERNGCPYA